MAFSSIHCHPFSLPYPIFHLKPVSCAFKPLAFNFFVPFASTSSSSSILTPSSTQQLPPDFSPSQLLDALRRQKDESEAVRIFEWASQQPNFVPNSSIYEELLHKLGKVGSFDSMMSVLKEMKSSGCVVDRGTFFIFIESYANFQLYEEISGVLQVMEDEFGLKPDTHFYNFLLNVLVDGN